MFWNLGWCVGQDCCDKVDKDCYYGLKGNLGEFIEVIEGAVDRAEQSQRKMQLDELELTVEINGEGQVSLLGTGGKVGTKGAIKLKFKRKDG